ncbi:asparagine synthase C-terminal domain-containing protein [Novosphingobium sp. G106]|uniref:asparagine synthase-related protein n=1 Tax=Novosphingobium sp. G106 TaxID=2849500 RepID=UPI001C2CDFC6|nr:asparagine synthetase B family protein [Novosphingobium sp. G106]MBV1686400.1 asparagine synthase C-terminal domain-containing protein [Novosphingobium sp. G106]
MSHFALLASTGPSEEAASSRSRLAALARAKGMIEIARNAVGILLVEPESVFSRVTCGEAQAFLFGEAFEKELRGRSRSNGIQALLEGLWGDFTCIAVSIWPEPRVEVAPSLFGTMRVFAWDPAPNLRLYTSSLDLGLALVGAAPGIDLSELSAFLLRSTFPRRRTCLSGIEQVLPGTIDSYGPFSASTRLWWDPWQFVPSQSAGEWADRPDSLRRIILDCVAKTARGTHPLLELSGGFDSSILAHSLSEVGIAFESVTLVSSAADGDERDFARIAAGHAGACLAELSMRVEDVNVTQPPAIRTVQPGPHILAQHMDRLSTAVAADLGCDSFISGGGGDNVFFATYSVVPIVDLWRNRRSLAATWQAIRDVAAITNVAPSDVVWRSIYRSWWRDEAPRWERETDFLAPALCEARGIEHPWFSNADLSRPGVVRHVRSLIGILPCLDGYPRGRGSRLKFPLLSQPIVEHCLAVPSWEWIRSGRDRAYARRAFDGFVPDALLARRQKGALDGMFAQLFNANRQILRDHLLGGYLAGQGLLDARAVDLYLSARPVLTDKQYYRLIELAGYENWCRTWT